MSSPRLLLSVSEMAVSGMLLVLDSRSSVVGFRDDDGSPPKKVLNLYLGNIVSSNVNMKSSINTPCI